MIKKVILWILVIGCMATIFGFSSQKAEKSKKTSSKVIVTIVKTCDINNKLSDEDVRTITENLTFIVRKGAHFSIYAILGVLVLLLLNEYSIFGKKAVIFSVLIACLYACSDEFHQTFVSGRSGELRDIIIDTVGALTGCMAVVFLKYLRKKFGRKKNGLH